MAEQYVKNGRQRALGVLDTMFSHPDRKYPDNKNLQLLREDFQKEFEAGPAKFFKDYVMPNLPKEMRTFAEVEFNKKTTEERCAAMFASTVGVPPGTSKAEENRDVNSSGKQQTSGDDAAGLGAGPEQQVSPEH